MSTYSYHFAMIYMACHHVTCTWHFNCYKTSHLFPGIAVTLTKHVKWSCKSQKRTGHVFYMASPSHATGSAAPSDHACAPGAWNGLRSKSTQRAVIWARLLLLKRLQLDNRFGHLCHVFMPYVSLYVQVVLPGLAVVAVVSPHLQYIYLNWTPCFS